MRPKEVSDKLQLEKIAKDHVWKVEPSCATTGEGIFEGLVKHIAIRRGKLQITNLSTGMAQQQRQAPTRRQVRHRYPRYLLRRVRLHARATLHIPGFLSNVCAYPI